MPASSGAIPAVAKAAIRPPRQKETPKTSLLFVPRGRMSVISTDLVACGVYLTLIHGRPRFWRASNAIRKLARVRVHLNEDYSIEGNLGRGLSLKATVDMARVERYVGSSIRCGSEPCQR